MSHEHHHALQIDLRVVRAHLLHLWDTLHRVEPSPVSDLGCAIDRLLVRLDALREILDDPRHLYHPSRVAPEDLDSALSRLRASAHDPALSQLDGAWERMALSAAALDWPLVTEDDEEEED